MRHLFRPTVHSDWSPPDTFPRLWNAKSITVDTETYDKDLSTRGPGWFRKDGGRVVGIALECDGWTGYYPVAHEGGGNLDEQGVGAWLRDCLGTNGPEKVFHNEEYDRGWLKHFGVIVRGACRDTLKGAPLLDENRLVYALGSFADWTGVGKNEETLEATARQWGVDPKADLWQLPAAAVGHYAEQDVVATRALWQHEEPRLREQDLWPVFELESALAPVLMTMKENGVRIDLDAADRLRLRLSRDYVAMVEQQIRTWGRRVEPKSADSIAGMCKELGIDYQRTRTGRPSFTKFWLDAHSHPFIKQINELRRMRTMQSLLKGIIYDYEINGRIHANFNALRSDEGGTVSGRFSSSLPNLQQVPYRDPTWGPLFRSLFLPEHGEKWCSADYSQQEYRLIVHYALLLRLPGAREAAQAYEEEGADFHQIVADMLGLPNERTRCKNLNFGLAYCMGPPALAAQLGVTLEEALPLIDRYHERAPFVRGLTRACSNRAEARGYVRTIAGRRCRFDLWEPAYSQQRGNGARPPALPRAQAERVYANAPLRRAFLHKAMNRVIQGSGADITKRAMVEAHRQGARSLLQVHDELDFSIRAQAEAGMLEEIMSNTTKTYPAMKAEVGIGRSWGEAH